MVYFFKGGGWDLFSIQLSSTHLGLFMTIKILATLMTFNENMSRCLRTKQWALTTQNDNRHRIQEYRIINCHIILYVLRIIGFSSSETNILIENKRWLHLRTCKNYDIINVKIGRISLICMHCQFITCNCNFM